VSALSVAAVSVAAEYEPAGSVAAVSMAAV
jgi:hypothetical protein